MKELNSSPKKEKKRTQATQEATDRWQKASLIVLKTIEGRKSRKTQRMGRAEDPYLVGGEFTRMRNNPQDRADMGQRKRVFMDTLNKLASPEQTEARKHHLARGLCKWHFSDGCKWVDG